MASRELKDEPKRVLEMRLEGRDQTIIVTAQGAVRELARELGFGVVDQMLMRRHCVHGSGL